MLSIWWVVLWSTSKSAMEHSLKGHKNLCYVVQIYMNVSVSCTSSTPTGSFYLSLPRWAPLPLPLPLPPPFPLPLLFPLPIPCPLSFPQTWTSSNGCRGVSSSTSCCSTCCRVWRGTLGFGQVTSLVSSVQNCRMLLYRYHWRTAGKPLTTLSSGNSGGGCSVPRNRLKATSSESANSLAKTCPGWSVNLV